MQPNPDTLWLSKQAVIGLAVGLCLLVVTLSNAQASKVRFDITGDVSSSISSNPDLPEIRTGFVVSFTIDSAKLPDIPPPTYNSVAAFHDLGIPVDIPGFQGGNVFSYPDAVSDVSVRIDNFGQYYSVDNEDLFYFGPWGNEGTPTPGIGFSSSNNYETLSGAFQLEAIYVHPYGFGIGGDTLFENISQKTYDGGIFQFTISSGGTDSLNFYSNVLVGPSTTTTTVVPLPAAVCLFSSGLLGLLGVTRRMQLP